MGTVFGSGSFTKSTRSSNKILSKTYMVKDKVIKKERRKAGCSIKRGSDYTNPLSRHLPERQRRMRMMPRTFSSRAKPTHMPTRP